MKHIVVSGCSFTNNFRNNFDHERAWEKDPIDWWTWANWLQHYKKDTHILHNYGTLTNDNKTIVRSIIYKIYDLLKSGVDPNDITVIAQFTSITRNSFFVSPEKYEAHNNPVGRWERTGENWPHTCDFLINGKDKRYVYEQGYFHLTGGYNDPQNPINIHPLSMEYFDRIMTYNERYYDWFESIIFLLSFCKANGIDENKIKFFTMNNCFSKDYLFNYLQGGKTPPFYNTPNNNNFYECLVEIKDICNTWNQKEIEFENSYVKYYADKIDFKKYFWFFEEKDLHMFGGLIEWSIRNFTYDLKSNLPIVLWREMNGMDIQMQKNYLEKSWYGHTSSVLTKKFVNEIVLGWNIFN